MIVRKTSIFPATRDVIFAKLQQLETLQYIAAPYATFAPVEKESSIVWRTGSTYSFRFKLFGLIPFGTHVIHIERFAPYSVQSIEGNEHVPVWNHKITLTDLGKRTEYTDEVEIGAGWKTFFIWLWAKAFYTHRQRKWRKLIEQEK